MPFILHTPTHSYTADDIKNAQKTFDTDYQSAFEFCKEWLTGKQTFIVHTSGSTGIPQPIQITRQQIEASVKATANALQLSSEDNALICLNTGYIAGKMMLARAMYLQMNAFIVPPTAQPFEYLNPKTKIDFAAFVPLQVQKIVETNLLNRLAQIQNVIVGGAALHQTIEEQLVSLANRIFSTYGMTETVSHIALRRINGNSKSNAYQVLSGISTRQDERGCLAVKGEVTTDKWLQTNDIVQFDTPTSFQLLGRADNIINSGGIKVQPERLEQQIAPLLAKYGVFCRYAISSQPDEKLGEKIILVTESQLDTLIKQTLLKELPNFCPPYQQPKQIITVTEFPQTATDKIHRGKLKEILKSK